MTDEYQELRRELDDAELELARLRLFAQLRITSQAEDGRPISFLEEYEKAVIDGFFAKPGRM